MTDQPESRGLDPDAVIDIPVLLRGGCGVLWNGDQWQAVDAAGRVLAVATRTDVPDFVAAIEWADPIAAQVWQATQGHPTTGLFPYVTNPDTRQRWIDQSAEASRNWADAWDTPTTTDTDTQARDDTAAASGSDVDGD